MSPLILAAIAAIVVVAIVIGSDLFRDLAEQRADLTREQRQREDEARRQLAGIEERNFYLDVTAGVFDPLGLFH